MTEREHVTPEEEKQLQEERTIDDLDVPAGQQADVGGGGVDMFLKIKGE